MTIATLQQVFNYENAYPRPGYSIVYGLCHPVTREVRYIGITKGCPRNRFRNHRSEARRLNTYKACWMRSVLRETEQEVVPALLDVVPNSERVATERRLIAETDNLTNATEGGEGVIGLKHSPETKEKCAAARRGKKTSSEIKAKMSVSAKSFLAKNPRTDGETRGKAISEGHKKLWASRGPKVFSDAHKRNISKAKMGHMVSDETRRKISETKRRNARLKNG